MSREIKLDLLQLDALRAVKDGDADSSTRAPNDFWEELRALGVVTFAQVGREWQRQVTPAGEAVLAAHPKQCGGCEKVPPIGPHLGLCRQCLLCAMARGHFPDREIHHGPFKSADEAAGLTIQSCFDLAMLTDDERALVEAEADRETTQKAAQHEKRTAQKATMRAAEARRAIRPVWLVQRGTEELWAGPGEGFAIETGKARPFHDRAEAERVAGSLPPAFSRRQGWHVVPARLPQPARCGVPWTDGACSDECVLPSGHGPHVKHEGIYGFQFSSEETEKK